MNNSLNFYFYQKLKRESPRIKNRRRTTKVESSIVIGTSCTGHVASTVELMLLPETKPARHCCSGHGDSEYKKSE